MLCTSLGLLPFSSQSFSFTIYGILSGALLATGTSITFVSQNTLGTTTAYSLVVAGGMLTRFGWEVLFLNSFDLDFFFFLPVAMLIGGVVACIKLHERNVRFGLASVSLDFFGVREVATVSVHVTSVPMLKAQIRRHFEGLAISFKGLRALSDLRTSLKSCTVAALVLRPLFC